MAHFAKLNENNEVIQVNVINNEDIQNLEFPESEAVGIAFLTEWSGGYTNWKQVSYNGNFRKNYAGIGFSYDPVRDAFIPPKPFASWLLDEGTCRWNAPVAIPDSSKNYVWDEKTTNWIEITE
jgi:hypothetical protein